MQVSPTPSRGLTLRMPGANRTSCSAFVVSLHRDGLLCTPAPGLLQPGTGHGVHCVSASREPEHRTNSALWLHREASPQRGSYPSTNSPRQQPYRITAAVALLWLPPVPCPRSHALRRRRFGQLSAPAGKSDRRCPPRPEPMRAWRAATVQSFTSPKRRSSLREEVLRPDRSQLASPLLKGPQHPEPGNPALLAAQRRRELVPPRPKPPRPVMRCRSTASRKLSREPPEPCRQHDLHRRRTPKRLASILQAEASSCSSRSRPDRGRGPPDRSRAACCPPLPKQVVRAERT